MFGNSETQYISIMGKRGLTVYFIASNSMLCLCVRVFLLTAGFWHCLSGLWLMKTEVMKDIFNILWALFGWSSLKCIRIQLNVANPYLSLFLSLSTHSLCLSSNFILLLKHHWSLRAIDHTFPCLCSLLSFVLSKHTEQQEPWQWINQFKEWNVCFCTAMLGKDYFLRTPLVLWFNVYFLLVLFEATFANLSIDFHCIKSTSFLSPSCLALIETCIHLISS